MTLHSELHFSSDMTDTLWMFS